MCSCAPETAEIIATKGPLLGEKAVCRRCGEQVSIPRPARAGN